MFKMIEADIGAVLALQSKTLSLKSSLRDISAKVDFRKYLSGVS